MTTTTGYFDDRHDHGPADDRGNDWAAWLRLSTTPPTRTGTDPLQRLHLHAGLVTRPKEWPTVTGARIYVAFDDTGPVYVGQTNRSLLTRIRRHFENQRTPQQRLKAGSWDFVVTASFPGLTATELDECERAAAHWLLHHGHRVGRRHPRPT